MVVVGGKLENEVQLLRLENNSSDNNVFFCHTFNVWALIDP